MSTLLENEPDILAKAIMRGIMLDNGVINAMEPDRPGRYPAKHVAAIGAAAKAFFDVYPDLLTDKAIYDLATGEIEASDTFAGFGSVEGISKDETRLDTSSNPYWMALNTALDDYFNDGL